MRVMHVVAALLVAIACACTPARGQGTSNAVPEPISTTELHDLLRRYVSPTREDWDAIEGLHDDYRASFKQLREGDIEKLLQSQRSIEGGGFPARDKFEKLMRDTERVTKRIGELDGTLFEGIAVVVGDDKRQGVTRAANARLRQRELRGGSMSAMGMMNATDMSPIIIDSFADSPESLATITPDLIEYEERLTSSAKGAGDDALSMWSDMFRELEKAGFSEMTEEDMRNNPERMTALMETAQRAMQEAGKKVQKRVQSIRELNDRTYRTLSGKLSGDPQRRLRAVYLRRAHPMVGYDTTLERLFVSLEKSTTIEPELKERLRVERTNFVQANDAIIDQLVKLDNERTESSDLFNPFGGGDEEVQKKLQELQAKRAELQERTVATLRPMVGDERYDRIFQRLSMAAENANPFAAVDIDTPEETAVEAGTHEAVVEGALMYAAGNRLPPLDIGMIQMMAGSMNLDAGMKSTLETMHADYQKAWTDTIAPLLEDLAQQANKQWTPTEDGTMRWNAEAVSAHSAKQREVVAKAIDLDEAFFADVLKVLGESHTNEIVVVRLDRVSMIRQLRPDLFGAGFLPGDEEAPVPVLSMLNHQAIPDDARPAARAAVAAVAASAIPKLRELDAATMANATEMQNLGMTWSVHFEGGQQPDAAAIAKFQQESMKLQAKGDELRRERQKILTSIFDAMKSAVPEANRDALQLAYDKAAFPSVFNDPRSALSFLDRASTLPDLTPEQRTRLDAVRAEYERDYFAACRRMAIRNPTTPASSDPTASYREYAARQNERMKIQFERDERSARAVSQVRRVLTDEQIKQVPGLGDYEQNLKGQSNGGFGYPLD